MQDIIKLDDVYSIIDGKALNYEEEIQSLDKDENRSAIEELVVRIDTLEALKEWFEFNVDSNAYDYHKGMI